MYFIDFVIVSYILNTYELFLTWVDADNSYYSCCETDYSSHRVDFAIFYNDRCHLDDTRWTNIDIADETARPHNRGPASMATYTCTIVAIVAMRLKKSKVKHFVPGVCTVCRPLLPQGA